MIKPEFAIDARGQVATHGPQTPKHGVIHSTESYDRPGLGDIQSVLDYWRSSQPRYEARLGSHFLIDSDGNIAIAADPHKITYAVANRNTGSIHVELIGFSRFSLHAWFVRIKQLRALSTLIAWINQQYGVPIVFDIDSGWSRHRDQPGQTHTDPGLGFPLGFVLRLARKYRQHE